jgi:hypothetical protein
LILTQVNDGRLGASRDLRRVRSYLGDGLLLPRKYGVTYLLQLGDPLSNRVDMALDPVQVKGMALPAISRAPGERTQCLCVQPEPGSFLLDLEEER